MRNLFFSLILFVFLAFSVSAQTKEARQFDEFGRLPCGDFEARMNLIRIESQNSPDSKIYVVYYGGKFRKEYLLNKKTNNLDRVQLKYPHREDGLNWAKSIPLYLTTEETYPAATRDSFKDKIILINGGFREDTAVEIWLVPKDAKPPKPTPDTDEKDIKFRGGKPRRVPNFTNCYS